MIRQALVDNEQEPEEAQGRKQNEQGQRSLDVALQAVHGLGCDHSHRNSTHGHVNANSARLLLR